MTTVWDALEHNSLYELDYYLRKQYPTDSKVEKNNRSLYGSPEKIPDYWENHIYSWPPTPLIYALYMRCSLPLIRRLCNHAHVQGNVDNQNVADCIVFLMYEERFTELHNILQFFAYELENPIFMDVLHRNLNDNDFFHEYIHHQAEEDKVKELLQIMFKNGICPRTCDASHQLWPMWYAAYLSHQDGQHYHPKISEEDQRIYDWIEEQKEAHVENGGCLRCS
jgi:hypothetical protein